MPGNLLTGDVPCMLALEDGVTELGRGFGMSGTAVGEIVFNTSMIGYQEILTDPSYAGQIITLTYPEIGNYGICDEDNQSSRIYARGLIVHHLSRSYSNWRAVKSLPEFLFDFGITGITGIDTRAITKHIRDKGAMRCAISTEILSADELIEIARAAAPMSGADFTNEVTTQEHYSAGKGPLKIAVLDFGIKRGILQGLASQGMQLTIYPARTKADAILSKNPDGIFLSNGPGDPAACVDIIQELPALIQSNIPIFGICLGHQLLAIALGAKTYKLKFGHRGGNQPVKDLTTGKVEITSHNHGFAVDQSTLPKELELTHINLNDSSVEGFRHRQLPIVCVQYHPEASPGPHDAAYLFERFRKLIESHRRVPSRVV